MEEDTEENEIDAGELDVIISRYRTPSNAKKEEASAEEPVVKSRALRSEERSENVVTILERELASNRHSKAEEAFPKTAIIEEGKEEPVIEEKDRMKYSKWVKQVERAIQECLSQAKGVILSIYVVLPDGNTCLSCGGRPDIDPEIFTAIVQEQFDCFDSYDRILQLGGLEEVELDAKKGTMLIKTRSGLKGMAILKDKANAKLAKLYLAKMLNSVPESW